MGVNVYSSSDASAPTLAGVAGALTDLLQVCLKDGYGAKAGAGWAVEFTATNKRVFRAASGNRLRLRVDDTGVLEARITGYEVMTGVDTGTGQFPNTGQINGGAYFVRKSNTADSTSRPWMLIADERTFYFYCDSADAGGTNGSLFKVYSNQSQNLSGHFMFGEFTSFKPGDNYNTMIYGADVTGLTRGVSAAHLSVASGFGGQGNFYIARPFYQSGGSTPSGIFCPQMTYAPSPGSWSVMGLGAIVLPDPVTGAILYSPCYVMESVNGQAVIRGVMRGKWSPTHYLGQSRTLIGFTIEGSGEMTGKTLIHVPGMSYLYSASDIGLGVIAHEISNTWSA